MQGCKDFKLVGNLRDLKIHLEIQGGFHFSFIYILGKTFKIQGMAFKKLQQSRVLNYLLW